MKKKKIAILPLIIVVAIFFSGCRTFFLPDIKNNYVHVNSPVDGLITADEVVSFWWEELDGAESYNLQIVSPSFDSVQRLYFDSMVVGNKVDVKLPAGNYQWRIRGENYDQYSKWVTRSLNIVLNDTLGAKIVVLKKPSDNAWINSSSIGFSWFSLTGADDYRFDLLDASSNPVIAPIITSNDSTVITGLVDGTYTWKVKANNAFSSTAYSSRTINIDLINPSTPTLNLPLYNDTASIGLVNFSWTRGVDGGSPITDSFFIYNDSLLSSLHYNAISTTLSTSVTLSIGTYFWRLKGVDVAGNFSSYSSIGKVRVQ